MPIDNSPLFQRRRLLTAGAAMTLSLVANRAAGQGKYPVRPITFVTPQPPGGPTDILARLIALHMGRDLGQPFVVDNRAGAGGAIGAEQAIRAEADGYTLLMSGLPLEVLNPALYGTKLAYDPVGGIRHVGIVAHVPYVLVVNKDLPADDLPSLVKLLKANPGKYNYGTPGAGNTSHIVAEMFRKAAEVDITHVPYKGDAPAMQDLIGGQVQLVFTLPVSALPHIQSGRVKAIGTAAAQRTPVLADLKTFKEQGIAGVEAETWFSVVAPKATPGAVVDRLNASLNKVLNMPEVRTRLAELGARAGSGTAAEADTFAARERARWTPLVKASGATMN